METVFEPDSGRVPLTETRLHEIEEAVEAFVEEGTDADRADADATEAVVEFDIHEALVHLKERVEFELALDGDAELERGKLTREDAVDAFEERVHEDESTRLRDLGHALDDAERNHSMTVSHDEVLADSEEGKRARADAHSRAIGHALDDADHAERLREGND